MISVGHSKTVSRKVRSLPANVAAGGRPMHLWK